MLESECFNKGVETILKVDSPSGVDKTLELGDLGRYIIGCGWGEIFNRPGLSWRDREMCIVSSLIAMGGCPGPLRSHMELAMNIGVTREELNELIIQASLYCGMPKAVEAQKQLNGLLQGKK